MSCVCVCLHTHARARAHTHTHTHTGVLIGKMVNPPGGWYKRILRQCRLQDLQQQAEDSPGWVDDFIIGLKLAWFQHEWLKAVTYLTSWVTIGVMYGMLSSQRMRFLTALYFAVTCPYMHPLPSVFPVRASYAFGSLYVCVHCMHCHHAHFKKTWPPERGCIRRRPCAYLFSAFASMRGSCEAHTHVHAPCDRSLLSQRLVWKG